MSVAGLDLGGNCNCRFIKRCMLAVMLDLGIEGNNLWCHCNCFRKGSTNIVIVSSQ